MSDITDVITLYKELKSETDKQKFCEVQHETMVNLLHENERLKAEVNHLKSLLVGTSPVIEIIKSAEELLIEKQIAILHKSGERELTLEETKKLDLLIKNKKIYKDQAKIIDGDAKRPTTGLSRETLIAIASGSEKKPE